MKFASRTSDTPVRDAFVRAAVLYLCAIMSAATAGLAGVTLAGAATPVTVEAGPDDGFGRIVMTFAGRNDLPKYQAHVTNGVLVVEFAESVSANVDRVAIKLPDYVTVARTDPDGSAVRMALARAVKVNTMEAGEKLFIDLMPHDWVGRPPGLPKEVVAELARRARVAAERARLEERRRLRNGDMPTVEFSVGRHPTFSRFSFTWSGPYLASFSRSKDTVIVEFDQAGMIDIGPVKADLPPQVLSVETGTADDGGMQFRVTVAASAEVRAFRDGDAYIVDVMTGQNAAAAAPGSIEAEIAAAKNSGLDAAVPGSVTVSGPSERPE
ncbi:MAG: hypothetical protein KDJ16_18655, partial [Hyphomicrobiales bacterium]|nr:hypothetical protein [Hyphomicrobiales bacterium]